MLQPIIEGETAHFFEEIKVRAMQSSKMHLPALAGGKGSVLYLF